MLLAYLKSQLHCLRHGLYGHRTITATDNLPIRLSKRIQFSLPVRLHYVGCECGQDFAGERPKIIRIFDDIAYQSAVNEMSIFSKREKVFYCTNGSACPYGKEVENDEGGILQFPAEAYNQERLRLGQTDMCSGLCLNCYQDKEQEKFDIDFWS